MGDVDMMPFTATRRSVPPLPVYVMNACLWSMRSAFAVSAQSCKNHSIRAAQRSTVQVPLSHSFLYSYFDFVPSPPFRPVVTVGASKRIVLGRRIT